ncbi:MAG TPA: peptidoglycan-associated lipoprotein Pal [Longimicrobium sp.]|jgi:peptidoglycan-associated lipoprotein
MRLRRLAVLLLTPLVVLGCRKRRPADGPAPNDTTTAATAGVDGGDAGSAREDSIRLAMEEAERERLERERRGREAATAAAREALTEIVFFDYDSDQITPEAERRLVLKAAVLRDNPTVRIRIEGHADQRGSTEYNLALGQRRAEAVRAFLANYGIDADRFATISYGKERPLVEGEGEESWSRNRRAEFAITGGEITTVPAELRR